MTEFINFADIMSMDTKYCSTCKVDKLVERFDKNAARKDGLQAKCKSCRTEYNKIWYQKNTALQKSRIKISKDKRLSERCLYVDGIKTVPCLDCNGTFDPVCMDFDHVRGLKLFDVSVGVRNKAWQEVLDEIDKCEIVCSNCHRIRTKNRRGVEQFGSSHGS